MEGELHKYRVLTCSQKGQGPLQRRIALRAHGHLLRVSFAPGVASNEWRTCEPRDNDAIRIQV